MRDPSRGSFPGPGRQRGDDDRLLTIDEAAARLAVSKDWLRRRVELPFVVKLSDGAVRYSSKRLDLYIARQVAR